MEPVDYDLEEHFNEEDMSEIVSNCCGVGCLGDSDICSDCIEHCEPITLGEYLFRENEDTECDEADALKELKNEES